MISRSVSLRHAVDICGGGVALSSILFLLFDIRRNLQLLNRTDGWSEHAPYLVLASAAAYGLAHLLRAIRLWVIIGPDRLCFSTVFGCQITVALLTFATPFKVGEILRAGEFFRLMNQNVRSLFAVWLDRLLDASVMLSLLSLFVYWRPMDSRQTLVAGVLAGFILFSLLVVLVMPGAVVAFSRALLQSKSRRSLLVLRISSRIRGMLEEVPRLDAKALSLLLIVTLSVWGLELVTVLLGLAALPAAGSAVSDQVLDLLNYTLVVQPGMRTPHLALYRLVCIFSLPLMLVAGIGGYVSRRKASFLARNARHSHNHLPVFVTSGIDTRGRIR